jgi:hypothetical protein
MKPSDAFRQGMDRLSEALKEVSNPEGRRRSHVNVSSRRNIVIEGSFGENGGMHSASSSQNIRIRQDGKERVDESAGSPTSDDR